MYAAWRRLGCEKTPVGLRPLWCFLAPTLPTPAMLRIALKGVGNVIYNRNVICQFAKAFQISTNRKIAELAIFIALGYATDLNILARHCIEKLGMFKILGYASNLNKLSRHRMDKIGLVKTIGLTANLNVLLQRCSITK